MGGSSTRSTRQASASRRAIRSCNVIFVIITILGVFITACLPNPPATPDTKQGDNPAAKQSTPATTNTGNPSAAKPASAPTRVPGGPAKHGRRGWPRLAEHADPRRAAVRRSGPRCWRLFVRASSSRVADLCRFARAARYHAFESDIHGRSTSTSRTLPCRPRPGTSCSRSRPPCPWDSAFPGQDVIANETMQEFYGALALSMSPYLQESMPGLTVSARGGTRRQTSSGRSPSPRPRSLPCSSIPVRSRRTSHGKPTMSGRRRVRENDRLLREFQRGACEDRAADAGSTQRDRGAAPRRQLQRLGVCGAPGSPSLRRSHRPGRLGASSSR